MKTSSSSTDKAINRDFLGVVLSRAGADVIFAEHGQAAIDIIERSAVIPDLILMDMQMPVMDGYTATQFLMRSGCGTPIVALTANAMRGDEQKCRDAGCAGFLTKPIKIDVLLQALEDHLAETCQGARNGSGESDDAVPVPIPQSDKSAINQTSLMPIR